MLIKEINYSYTVISTDDIEIKHYLIDLLSVFLPGYKFMPQYKAGIIDGKKKYYSILNDGSLRVASGLIPLILKKLDDKEYSYNVEYLDKIHNLSIPSKTQEDFKNDFNLPFEPYLYQVEATLDALEKQRKVIQMCTGSGKSLVIGLISEVLYKNDLKTVIIVPNINLLEQLKDDFKSYNLTCSDEVKVIGGDSKIKNFDSKITISTWQSLNNLIDIFDDVDAILVDECHQVKADVLSNIIKISSNTSIKLGFTGTLPELMIDKMELLGTIGPNKEYISAIELIEKGLGTPIEITGVFLSYSAEEAKAVKKMKYQQEVKFLNECTKRTKFISNFSNKVAKKFGNTLVLFNQTKHGTELYEEITGVKLTSKLKNDYKEQAKLKVFFVNGEVKGSVREEIRKIIEDLDNCIIVANFAVLSTGVNIPNLHAMVLAASSKSEVRIRQSLGRGIRKHSSKDKFRVFDIVDDITYFTKSGNPHENYALKHWESRNNTYQNQYFDIREIEFQLS